MTPIRPKRTAHRVAAQLATETGSGPHTWIIGVGSLSRWDRYWLLHHLQARAPINVTIEPDSRLDGYPDGEPSMFVLPCLVERVCNHEPDANRGDG